jgi:uncharacterized protein YecA (UPF0149 family)
VSKDWWLNVERAGPVAAAGRRATHDAIKAQNLGTLPPGRTLRREEPKIGRNDPCPCGSGAKSKRCWPRGCPS